MLKILGNSARTAVGILRTNVNFVQVANLMGRRTRGEPLKLRPGFPYQDRSITNLEALMDLTVRRTEEENAKLIVVEGPIAAGKTAFMKMLADEFDMVYMEQPTLDEIYITRTGFDLRTFDDQLPESVRTFDHKNFLACPKHRQSGSFQGIMLQLRFSQYIDALAHILNTGQGVILERSPYSDYVFIEAMLSEGYIEKCVRDSYMLVLGHITPLILRPHVVIYLDVPVNKVQERIKQRNLSYEVNSPALTQSYLQKLEDLWKYDYLKEADAGSEVLVYDWSDGGDMELIIEDLEELDLNPLRRRFDDSEKLLDWQLWRRELRLLRLRYTNEKSQLMRLISMPLPEMDKYLISDDDVTKRKELYSTAPGHEYAIGGNPKYDSIWNTLLGRKPYSRRVLTLISGNE